MELLAGNFLGAIAGVINAVLSLYFWIVIASAVLSWVNPDPYNPIVRIIRNLTEPVFYRVRKLLPFTNIGGLDLSPVVILLGIEFIKMFLVRTLYQFAGHM
ncbi:YggT family protein [Desulfovibrio subterraneus]|jgi:YggT family protein|uniref:YggT family protein n=1 Tax=Desulfovibrio subterraneus TaxID=2718620 RepID=A0A7J0BL00_9BACT|nr:YggT family protein [Desulfovibrio subterraneus]WBF67880.1 YggT family protein [Desulfovibrio subterraneus]GFM33744.1 YggT family protein [Desulfovibrio subterraneus]